MIAMRIRAPVLVGARTVGAVRSSVCIRGMIMLGMAVLGLLIFAMLQRATRGRVDLGSVRLGTRRPDVEGVCGRRDALRMQLVEPLEGH